MTRSALPWVLRLADAGAAWVRAVRALPREDQGDVFAALELQLADTVERNAAEVSE